MSQKVFIVGAGGMVGSVTAYSLMVQELVEEIVLIDIDKEKLEGHYFDLFHASSLTKQTFVRMGDYSGIEENDIVIVTAGTAQKIGQNRLELVGTNSKIVEEITRNVMKNGKNIFLIIVANPVDVLTYIAYKVSGLEKSRVFGSGTSTDTARLNAYIANKFQLPHKDVECFVIGEHGESCFAAFSMSQIKGEPILNSPEFNKLSYDEVNKYIHEAAYKIINCVGATYFGIGSAVSEIVDGIVNNRNKLLTTSSIADGEYGQSNLAIGLPNFVNASGTKIDPTHNLDAQELVMLNSSANIIKEVIQKAGF